MLCVGTRRRQREGRWDTVADDDTQHQVRRARHRRPESYESVSAWWADYRGSVPITMAHALSRLTDTGMTFGDAYLSLIRKGAIVELDPWPRTGATAEDGDTQR